MKRLTTDYDELIQQYSGDKQKMIRRENEGAEQTFFPVLLEGYVENAVAIHDDKSLMYHPSPAVVHRKKELLSSYNITAIYDNLNVRVNDWEIRNGMLSLTTGRTTYFRSLMTNRCMDFECKDGTTVRKTEENGPCVHSLKESTLSNHLGFNGFLESADGKICFVQRAKNLSIGGNTVGTSVGASLKTKYALEHEVFTVKGLYNAIVEEYNDELKVNDTAANLNCKGLTDVRVIAAYRDLTEGGKPQLLVYAKTDLTANELDKGFRQEIQRKNDVQNPTTKAEKEAVLLQDRDKLFWVDRSELKHAKIYPDKMVVNGQEFTMMPSAAASVVMTEQYLILEKDRAAEGPVVDIIGKGRKALGEMRQNEIKAPTPSEPYIEKPDRTNSKNDIDYNL